MLKYFQLYENFGKAIQRFKMTRRPSSQPGSSPGTPYLPIFGTIPSRSALVKVRTKSQALEAAWPGNSIKAPRLWFFSGHQNPSSSGCLAESHVRLALIKHQTKSQTLQGAWQSHALKALVKKIAKCQALQIGGQGHTFKRQNRKVFKLSGIRRRSRLRFNITPRAKSSRLPGSVTWSRL